VSETPKSKPPRRPSDSEEETPLSLAESSEGSTMPVTGGEGTDAGAGPGSTPTPGQSSDTGPGGSTTGGFETTLGKLVVERGLASPEEVEMCSSLLKQAVEEEVFLAKQLSLDRLVAIKVLPKRLSANANFIERFYKEGRSAAQLNHPNIVSAYDVGRAGEHHYFVMEYVDGKTVYDRIVKGRRLEEAEAIEVVIQVAEALRHAHKRGFIHRDIKPKNIMISREGKAKLADLGLARALTDKAAAEAEAGRAYGTPYYISPEQIRGEVKIGPAADIYGLGATLYHMVTGRVPYEGKNPSSVMHKHLKAQLVPPDHVNPKISAGCAQVIEMMMAKKQSNRYERVDDVLHDLKLVQQGEPPHFAHRQIDLAAVTPALATEPQPAPVARAEPEDIMSNPVFRVVLVLLIISALANVVLAVLAMLK
jgi:serine/threonine-protein kinase